MYNKTPLVPTTIFSQFVTTMVVYQVDTTMLFARSNRLGMNSMIPGSAKSVKARL